MAAQGVRRPAATRTVTQELLLSDRCLLFCPGMRARLVKHRQIYWPTNAPIVRQFLPATQTSAASSSLVDWQR